MVKIAAFRHKCPIFQEILRISTKNQRITPEILRISTKIKEFRLKFFVFPQKSQNSA